MNVNEAIKYLILLADRYPSKGHGEYWPDGEFLIEVTKLLEQGPQTGDLKKEIESLRLTMQIHAGDICSANNETDRFVEMNKDLEEEIAAAMDKYEGEVIVNTRLRDSIRSKNTIIDRLNQRLSDMGGQC